MQISDEEIRQAADKAGICSQQTRLIAECHYRGPTRQAADGNQQDLPLASANTNDANRKISQQDQ